MNCASNAILELATYAYTETLSHGTLTIHKHVFKKCSLIWNVTKDSQIPHTWVAYMNFLNNYIKNLPEDNNFTDRKLKYLKEFLDIIYYFIMAIEALEKKSSLWIFVTYIIKVKRRSYTVP